MSALRKGELRNGTRLEEEHGPAVCPNGHAMDEGYFECPCCGAYRPSASGMTAEEYERHKADLRAIESDRRARDIAHWLREKTR